MRSFYSFIFALCAMAVCSQMVFAWTVNVEYNDKSGIEYATYTVTLKDGTILGFNKAWGANFKFCGAISNKREIRIPDTLQSTTDKYFVRKLGPNGVYKVCDMTRASKVTTLYLPTTLWQNALSDVALHPNIKKIHLPKNSKFWASSQLHNLDTVFVQKEDLLYYLNEPEWRRRVLIVEEGEKPLKLTVVVNKAGEFAQTLLQKVENMNKVNELKVIGPLNGEDLNKFKEMEQMAKLDLLDAKITDIPAYFCGDIEYINSTRSSGCYLLSEVALPNVNSIGSNAFHYCTHLKKITIPSSVTSIPDGCF